MADDIARIGIEFDTSGLRRGEKALRDVREAGRQTAGVAERVERSMRGAGTGARQFGSAINVAEGNLNRFNKNVRGAASSTNQFSQATREAARNTDRMVDNFRQTTSRAGGYSERMSAATSRQRNFGIASQNAAFQVQDFVVQVSSGTSASRALGQQLPQLLGQFGTVGAVVGALVAILGGLVNSLGAVEQETTSTEEATNRYKQSLEDANEFIERLNNNGLTRIERLKKEREEILEGARAMVEANKARLEELKLRNEQDLFGAGRRKRSEREQAEAAEELAASRERLEEQSERINKAIEQETQRIRENSQAANDNAGAHRENAERRQSVIAAMREQIELEQLDARERFQTQKVMEAQNRAMDRGNLLREQQIDRIRETAGELYDVRNATSDFGKEMQNVANDAGRFEDIVTGAMEDVGKDAVREFAA